MKNVFWPTTRNPAPSGFTRLGRVLHWVGFLIGLGFALLWLVGSFTQQANPVSQLAYIAIGAAGGLVLWLIGRALRYIFSGE